MPFQCTIVKAMHRFILSAGSSPPALSVTSYNLERPVVAPCALATCENLHIVQVQMPVAWLSPLALSPIAPRDKLNNNVLS